MANNTGSQPDILSRLQSYLPSGWFNVGEAPIKDALLTGFANMFAFLYSMLAYIKLQTRIATATDGWLDLIAYDFFGSTLARSPGQTDASFRNQIISTLLRKKNTVAAIESVIYQLLGTVPTVLEPNFAADTLCWDVPQSGGYDAVGIWGDSGLMPLQVFVEVTVPGSLSIAPPYIGGYGNSVWGYGVGMAEYAVKPALSPVVTADIYRALLAVRPVTGVFWTSITAGTSGPTEITTDSTVVHTDSTVITTDGGNI